MKTSVIYKVGGNDPGRKQRLEASIRSIRNCITEDYEVIVLEQVMDGNQYYDSMDGLYVTLVTPGKEFNIGWTGNVAARFAAGDTLLFVDADVIVPPKYLDMIEEANVQTYSHGSAWYTPLNAEDSKIYLENEIFYITEKKAKRYTEVHQPIFAPYTGHGYIRAFNKDWYWNVLGGQVEDFEVWGFEDTEMLLHRAHYMAGLTNLEEAPAFDSHCFHLHHDGRRDEGYSRNYRAFSELISYRACDRCDALKELHVGHPDGPRPLLPYLER